MIDLTLNDMICEKVMTGKEDIRHEMVPSYEKWEWYYMFKLTMRQLCNRLSKYEEEKWQMSIWYYKKDL